MNRYAITGGTAGKERLKLLSKVMLPFTSRLLREIGIHEGMRCLDVGCDGGFVTALLSGMVGPTGSVVGIDADESILELAREDAHEMPGVV